MYGARIGGASIGCKGRVCVEYLRGMHAVFIGYIVGEIEVNTGYV